MSNRNHSFASRIGLMEYLSFVNVKSFSSSCSGSLQSPGADHYLEGGEGGQGRGTAASQPVMVLDVTVTSDLSQVFTVVELRKVFQVTLEFSLTQKLLYPFGVY